MELKELRKLEELFKRKEQLTSLKDKLDEVSTDSLLREINFRYCYTRTNNTSKRIETDLLSQVVLNKIDQIIKEDVQSQLKRVSEDIESIVIIQQNKF